MNQSIHAQGRLKMTFVPAVDTETATTLWKPRFHSENILAPAVVDNQVFDITTMLVAGQCIWTLPYKVTLTISQSHHKGHSPNLSKEKFTNEVVRIGSL